MLRRTCVFLSLLLVFQVVPTFALSPGTDVFVPANARVANWRTDLIIYNPGDSTASVTLYLLERDETNLIADIPAGHIANYTITPGETADLQDVINSIFLESTWAGAFRVISDQSVVVTTRVYNYQSGVTFGQGYEGFPKEMATQAGDSTDIVGVVENDSFRTNFIMIDVQGDTKAASSKVNLTLLDDQGSVLGTATRLIDAYEPYLKRVNHSQLFGSAADDLDYGTIHCEVERGAVIFSASKVDNDAATGDPTTLAAWTAGGAVSADGTYQISVYDSVGYASGGYLTIEDDEVTALKATYANWDKGTDPEFPDCPVLFSWGGAIDIESLDDYETGVDIVQDFVDSGTITFTVIFDVEDNQSIVGTVDAVGSDFTGVDVGCNGTFPQQTLLGGKSSD